MFGRRALRAMGWSARNLACLSIVFWFMQPAKPSYAFLSDRMPGFRICKRALVSARGILGIQRQKDRDWLEILPHYRRRFGLTKNFKLKTPEWADVQIDPAVQAEASQIILNLHAFGVEITSHKISPDRVEIGGPVGTPLERHEWLTRIFSISPEIHSVNSWTRERIYIPDDFRHSPGFVGNPSPLYLAWAANQANLSAEAYREGYDPQRILDKIARSRVGLERELLKAGSGSANMNSKDLNFFQQERPFSTETLVGFGTNTPARILRNSENKVFLSAARRMLIQKIESKPWDRHKMERDSEGNLVAVSYQDTYYQTLAGENLRAIQVKRIESGREKGRIYLIHPANRQWNLIMDDAWKYLELARGDVSAIAHHFLQASRAFFIAMPYMRGSSSIGIPFWSGIGSSLLKEKIHLHPMTDWLAMIDDETEFEEEILRSHFDYGKPHQQPHFAAVVNQN